MHLGLEIFVVSHIVAHSVALNTRPQILGCFTVCMGVAQDRRQLRL